MKPIIKDLSEIISFIDTSKKIINEKSNVSIFRFKSISDAENGDIVVALINDNEVTLKKLKKDKDKIYLIPANHNYKIQSFSSDKIKIQGKLKGIIRSY